MEPVNSNQDEEELQKIVETLKQEKRGLESEFGQKRAKFMEMFKSKEEDLQNRDYQILQLQQQNEKLEKQMKELETELMDVQTAAAMLEHNKYDEIERQRKVHEEDVASLQSIMEVAADEASTSTAAKYEQEREKLAEKNKRLLSELSDLRSRRADSPSFLSSVTKSLKRVRVGGSANSSLDEENLEGSFKKAQEDAEVLRSVVIPLEEELKALKDKLRETDSKLQAYEGKKSPRSSPSKNSTILHDLSPEEKDDKIKEIRDTLAAEKSSRTDLEMYVAVLDTQKKVLSDDNDKLRAQLHDVCKLLDQERKEHNDLKLTWQMANDQFLESQRLMMMDMRRMESVLSSEQQRQISELQKKDLTREAQEKRVKELQEKRELVEKQTSPERNEEKEPPKLQRTNSAESKMSLLSTKSDDLFGEFQRADYGSIPTVSSTNTIPTTEDKMDSLSVHSAEGTLARISPDKVISIPGLTEAQHHAIAAPTPESEESKSLVDSIKQSSTTDIVSSLAGKRLVSDKEWEMLQIELQAARTKLGNPCDMCKNYEAQLVEVQSHEKEILNKLKITERDLGRDQQLVVKLRKEREELEMSLKNSAEDAQKQITDLSTKVQESEKTLSDIVKIYRQSQNSFQEQLNVLTAGREDIQKELTRLQTDNEALIGLHSKHSQQLQTEDIDLPNNLEDMQLLLLKYREDIITAKVAREHIESNLKSEILFLKDQVRSEQEEKNRMEETLTQEISGLEEKIILHQSVKSELDREMKAHNETESKLKEAEQQLRSIQAKTKQLIHALQIQLEEQTKARSTLETHNNQLRKKVQSLQVDLDNSEAVQRDFVKLSQSLQVQLEKIRSAENELRWQHEDDVEECTTCKQSFSVTKRKHHCRHCGRVFCSDCTSKIVHSGPNGRPSKVCDVCHTILVNDATPYFSKEPPASPD